MKSMTRIQTELHQLEDKRVSENNKMIKQRCKKRRQEARNYHGYGYLEDGRLWKGPGKQPQRMPVQKKAFQRRRDYSGPVSDKVERSNKYTKSNNQKIVRKQAHQKKKKVYRETVAAIAKAMRKALRTPAECEMSHERPFDKTFW